MSIVVPFPHRREKPTKNHATGSTCEVVIFPGVRIERHEVDLSARVADTAGASDYHNLGVGGPAG